MWCDEHDEKLWAPAGGEPRCLGHTFEHIGPSLGFSEEGDDAFREWLFDGADRNDDENDVLDRYGRALQLEQDPGMMVAAFWRDRPDTFRKQLEAYRQNPSVATRPQLLMPAEILDFLLVELEAFHRWGGESRLGLVEELLESLRAPLRCVGVTALARAHDLLLLLRSSEKLAVGRDRTGFQVAASRTRDLIAMLGGA